MTLARKFEVYREQTYLTFQMLEDERPTKLAVGEAGAWRWRLIAIRNGQITGGSQESFDSRANALRAARREASFYQPGVAVVVVEDAAK